MEEFGCFSGRACFGSRCLGFLGHDNICGGISLTAQAGEIALFGIWGVGLSLGMFVAFPKCGKALCHEALSVTRAGECAVGGDADRCSDMRSCGDAAGFVGRCGNVSWGLQSRETCGFFACGWSAMGPDALAMHGSSASRKERAAKYARAVRKESRCDVWPSDLGRRGASTCGFLCLRGRKSADCVSKCEFSEFLQMG